MFISVLVRRLKPGKTYDFIESTAVRGIYEIEDEFDFSTDKTVSRGRPGPER